MVDWSFVQVVLAIALVPFVLQQSWFEWVATLVRRVIARFVPATGACERLLWSDFGPGPLHVCSSALSCAGNPVFFQNFFNQRRSSSGFQAKPKTLSLLSKYLYVDRAIIISWILNATPYDKRVSPLGGRSRFNFEYMYLVAGSTMSIHQAQGIGPFICKIPSLRIRDHRRLRTKHEIDCIMKGYPPFYREKIVADHLNVYIPSPIRSLDDIFRGGWILAAGLNQDEPTNFYFDVFRETCGTGLDAKGRRGAVFWRSIRRVFEILDNVLGPAFEASSHKGGIKQVKAWLDHLIKYNTRSGAPPAFEHTCELSLTANDCVKAMDIFNGPPSNLSQAAIEHHVSDVEPIMPDVLALITRGVQRTADYIKEPGRELEFHLPTIIDESDYFFVEVES